MLSKIFSIYVDRADFFVELLGEHLAICGIAILCGGLLGLALGIFVSSRPKLAAPVIGITNIIYTIPSIALLGFLIPISGIGDTTACIALTIYALMPIVKNTYTGLIGVDPNIIMAAEGMGSTEHQIMWRIRLPLAFPVIWTGFRNMVVMVIAMGGIASFIGAGGLGVAIYRGITTNNLALTVAGGIIIALLAFLIDLALDGLGKYIIKKRRLL